MKSFFILSLLFFSNNAFSNNVTHLTDDVTGAQSWEVKNQGVVFYINQLLPDQLRAFYGNRGFSQEQIQSYVDSCVFMTVLRNESAQHSIRYQSKQWSVVKGNKSQSIKSVDQWVDELTKQGAKNSALIAFRWAQFPVEQEYEAGGDWNQGMLSLGAVKGSFDVIARWHSDSNKYQTKIKGVTCAQ